MEYTSVSYRSNALVPAFSPSFQDDSFTLTLYSGDAGTGGNISITLSKAAWTVIAQAMAAGPPTAETGRIAGSI